MSGTHYKFAPPIMTVSHQQPVNNVTQFEVKFESHSIKFRHKSRNWPYRV